MYTRTKRRVVDSYWAERARATRVYQPDISPASGLGGNSPSTAEMGDFWLVPGRPAEASVGRNRDGDTAPEVGERRVTDRRGAGDRDSSSGSPATYSIVWLGTPRSWSLTEPARKIGPKYVSFSG
jgi:hypothetical protein